MGSKKGRRTSRVAVAIVGAVAAGLALAGPSAAVPLFPGGPDIPLPVIPGVPYLDPAIPVPGIPGTPIQAPIGVPNFSAPSLNPSAGETIGIAQPIIIRFNEAVGDRATAERAIRVTTDPPVEGSFYWINDSQVRWKPAQFWPANISVTVDAGDSHSTFNIGDALVTVE